MKKNCFKSLFCSKEGFIKGCHSRGFLSGIFRILSSCRYKKDVIPNLIWDLPRLSLPLHLRNNLRGRWQIKSAMTSLCNRAFTLIELLVVVLIIGILAAVALPQYRVAVAKSRSMEIVTVLKAITDAQEVYFLANGEYTNDLSELDVDVPQSSKYTYQCWEKRTCGVWSSVVNVPSFEFHLNHAALEGKERFQGRHWCHATASSDVRNQVCKAIGGTLDEEIFPDYNSYYLN